MTQPTHTPNQLTQMPNQTQASDPLAQLRDIQLPDAISPWPPAPGWWIMTLFIIVVIFALIYWLKKTWDKRRYRQAALQQLNNLKTYVDQPNVYLQHLNSLLKRTAITAMPTALVAPLNGQQWLLFLDRSGSTTQFTQGVGKVLASGPYQPIVDKINIDELESLCQEWIKKHKPVSNLNDAAMSSVPT